MNKLNNRYEIIERQGEDAFVENFIAQDEQKSGAAIGLNRIASFNSLPHPARVHLQNTLISLIGLDHPGIERIFDVFETSDGLYVASEFLPGKKLSSMLGRDHPPYPIERCIRLSHDLCRAIDFMHGTGLYHGDLRPENITIVEDDAGTPGMAKIIHLYYSRISHALYGENQDLAAKLPLDMLQFVAPERFVDQSHANDPRSDLYSLGVVLYVAVTGMLPFSGVDRMSIIHEQVARMPVPAIEINNAVPITFNRILMKLMSKDPEARYQSAAGVLNDIMKLLAGNSDFIPGLEDRHEYLRFSTGIVGRSADLAHLSARYDSLVAGRGAVSLISGEAGIGKTMLCAEFRKQLYDKRVVVLSTKCHEAEGQNPYGVIVEAITEYIGIFSAYSPRRRDELGARLKKAVGEYNGVLARVIPSLSLLIGNTGAVYHLDAEKERNRFYLAISNLLYSIARLESGLVIICEDIQWADAAFFGLMEVLAQNISKYPLLIVGSFRPGETGYNHGVQRLVRHTRENGFPLDVRELAPLSLEMTQTLVGELLIRDYREPPVQIIAEFVHKKTGGNPYFCIELVKSMSHDRIFAVVDRGQLVVDQERFDAMDIPHSLIETIKKRVDRLNDAEKDILSIAALIGDHVEISALTDLCAGIELDAFECGIDDISPALEKAVRLHLVELMPEDSRMVFSHDIIKEIFYARIDSGHRGVIHRRLADQALAESSNENLLLHPQLFEIAFHVIESGAHDHDLAVVYAAGERAKEQHAFDDAYFYFSRAVEILERRLGGGYDHPGYRSIVSSAAEMCSVTGKDDQAISLYQRLLALNLSAIERAELYRHIADCYYKMGEGKRGEESAAAGLHLLNEQLPVTPRAIRLSLARELLKHGIPIALLSRLIRKPDRDAGARTSLVSDIYYSLAWSYVLNDTLKFVRTVFRMLHVSRGIDKNSREYARALALYAAVQMTLAFFTRSLLNHKRAFAIREALGDVWGMGHSYQLIGYCLLFTGKINEAKISFNKSVDLFRAIGDLKESGNSILGSIWSDIFRGDMQSRKEQIDRYSEMAYQIRDNFAVCYSMFLYSSYDIEVGEFAVGLKTLEKVCALTEKYEFWNLQCMATIDRGRYYLIREDDPATAISYLEHAREIYETRQMLKEGTSYVYNELALSHIYFYKKNKWDNKIEKTRYLNRIKKLSARAIRENRRSLPNYGSALRVQALFHSLKGKNRLAEKYFLRSLERTRAAGIPYETAKTLYEYGLFLHDLGRYPEAERMVIESYNVFTQIGNRYYRDLPMKYLNIRGGAHPNSTSDFYRQIKQDAKISLLLELIQALNGDRPLDELFSRALSGVMRLTGAERGYIVVNGNPAERTVVAAISIKTADDPKYHDRVSRLTAASGAPLVAAGDNEIRSLVGDDYGGEHTVKSLMLVPLRYQGANAGLCYLDNTLSTGVFGDRDAEAVQTIMDLVAVKIGIDNLSRNVTNLVDIEPNDAFCRTYGLSERERDIVSMIIKGLTRDTIAEKMSIKSITVRNHIYNIYSKTGAANKIELIELIKKQMISADGGRA